MESRDGKIFKNNYLGNPFHTYLSNLFSFFSNNILQKSGIWTLTIGAEDDHADHWATTTATGLTEKRYQVFAIKGALV